MSSFVQILTDSPPIEPRFGSGSAPRSNHRCSVLRWSPVSFATSGVVCAFIVPMYIGIYRFPVKRKDLSR